RGLEIPVEAFLEETDVRRMTQKIIRTSMNTLQRAFTEALIETGILRIGEYYPATEYQPTEGCEIINITPCGLVTVKQLGREVSIRTLYDKKLLELLKAQQA
ncbi:MAG: hypothetical protein ACI9GH_000110, partial [Candidatus Paceibacteria bacterium]